MGISRRDLLCSAGSLLAAHWLLRGQDPTSFSTDVKVVNVLATVSTRKGEIVLYDSVLLAGDNGSKTGLNDAVASAQRSDSLVYTILFKGEEGGFNNLQHGGGFGGHHGGMGGGRSADCRANGRRVLRDIG